jgi:CxxC-x17-CxxC domain-containing protein
MAKFDPLKNKKPRSSRGEARSSGGGFEEHMKRKNSRGSSGRASGTRSFKDRDSSRGSSRSSGRNFGGRSSGRDSSRGSSRSFGGRSSGRDIEMTKVTCSGCGSKCEVPFKPTSSKPVFCSDCFSKQDKGGSSSRDLDTINEKLDKIMTALDIV